MTELPTQKAECIIHKNCLLFLSASFIEPDARSARRLTWEKLLSTSHDPAQERQCAWREECSAQFREFLYHRDILKLYMSMHVVCARQWNTHSLHTHINQQTVNLPWSFAVGFVTFFRSHKVPKQNSSPSMGVVIVEQLPVFISTHMHSCIYTRARNRYRCFVLEWFCSLNHEEYLSGEKL